MSNSATWYEHSIRRDQLSRQQGSALNQPSQIPGLFQVPWSRAAWLGGLMFVSALTEGFGLVLLVPMLAALGGETAGAAGIAPRLAALGIPVAPGPLLIIFVALVMLRSLVNHARLLAAHGLEVTLVDRLRARAFEALLNCDWRTLSAMRQSDNASILITNIDRIGYGVNQLLAASAMTVTLGGLGIAALAISPPVALAALAGAALVLMAYRGMRRRAHRLGEELGESYRQVHGDIGEGLGALRIVKSFAAEDRMAQRSKAAFAGLRRTQRAYLRDQSMAQIALQTGGALVLALTVWLAIARWGAGTEQILPLVALFVRALPLLGNLQQAWQNWSHARAAIGEAAALIGAAEAGAEQVGHTASAVPPPRLDRAIRFEGVSVALRAGQPALDGISLELSARTTLAITGASGAGKSTLADLLGGLISPDAGLMLVDDVALDQANRRGWRAAVAYVQQEPVLFTGSVRENLLWARPGASEKELNVALERAAAGFVLALPGGLDHPLGEGARHLSGGERQRIALARALLCEPQLLILDEATSALDPAAEAEVARALAALTGQLTLVIVSHRGKLPEIADRVIELDAGRIVG